MSRASAFLLLFLVLPSAPLFAGDPGEALRINARAKEHYNRSEFDRALGLFEDAYLCDPQPQFLFNAAKACLRLEDTEGAVHFYRRYLYQAPEAEDRTAVEEEVMMLTANLLSKGQVEVRVETDPPGATMSFLPTHPTRIRSTPATIFLPRGAWTLSFEADGLEKQTIVLDLTAQTVGPELVSVNLLPVPTTGALAVSCSPSTATVLLNGTLVEDPAVLLALEPGEYEVSCTAQGFLPSSKNVSVLAGESGELSMTLVASKPPETARWRPAVWTVGGVAAAASVTGAILWGVGYAGMTKATDSYDGTLASYNGYRDDYNQGREMLQWGMGLTLAGAVVAGGAAAILLFYPKAPVPDVTFVPSQAGGSLFWSLEF